MDCQISKVNYRNQLIFENFAISACTKLNSVRVDNGNQLMSVCLDAIHETQQNGRYGVSLWEMVDKEEKNLFRVELFSLDDIRDTTQHTVTVQVLQTKLWTLADIAAFYVARQLKTKRRMEILIYENEVPQHLSEIIEKYL